jgi:hypothetical protein
MMLLVKLTGVGAIRSKGRRTVDRIGSVRSGGNIHRSGRCVSGSAGKADIVGVELSPLRDTAARRLGQRCHIGLTDIVECD